MQELGIKVPNIRRIPDKYMTSSSQLSSKYSAYRGRIGLEARGPWGDGWCASKSDPDPYIQVFFGRSTNKTSYVCQQNFALALVGRAGA